jgi:hypothetical protein
MSRYETRGLLYDNMYIGKGPRMNVVRQRGGDGCRADGSSRDQNNGLIIYLPISASMSRYETRGLLYDSMHTGKGTRMNVARRRGRDGCRANVSLRDQSNGLIIYLPISASMSRYETRGLLMMVCALGRDHE